MVNKRNVLLVNPAINKQKQFGSLGKLMLSVPPIPLCLVYLGNYLVKNGYDMKIHDEQVELLTPTKLQSIINEFSPGIIGFTCTTPSIQRTLKIAADIKQISEEIKIVLGNVHPTVLPEDCLKNKNIDIIVRGEGEKTIIELVKALEHADDLSKVDGISYRENGGFVHTNNREFVKDLDFFPKINWKLFPEFTSGTYSLEWVLSSRGCPYKCIYCSSRRVSGYQYRMNSPQRVIEEVNDLVHNYSMKFISFADDNFVVNKRRTKEICNLLIEKGYHQEITWLCQTRADAVEESLLALMKQAGCGYINFGIETGNQRLLDLIRKSMKIETITQAVEMARHVGLKTRGSFMLGLPTESYDESMKTIQYAIDLKLDNAKFNLAVPYPGTELLEMAIEEGFQVPRDWSLFNSMAGLGDSQYFYVPKGRTIEDLTKIQKSAHKRFYFRPKQLWRVIRRKNPDFNLPEIKSFGQFVELLKAVTGFLFKRGKKST